PSLSATPRGASARCPLGRITSWPAGRARLPCARSGVTRSTTWIPRRSVTWSVRCSVMAVPVDGLGEKPLRSTLTLSRRAARSLPPYLPLAMAAAPAASYGQPPPKPGGAATAPAPATSGHVTVRLAGGAGEPLRVIVDGVDVGATPWEGDLAPGPHQIAG